MRKRIGNKRHEEAKHTLIQFFTDSLRSFHSVFEDTVLEEHPSILVCINLTSIPTNLWINNHLCESGINYPQV